MQAGLAGDYYRVIMRAMAMKMAGSPLGLLALHADAMAGITPRSSDDAPPPQIFYLGIWIS